MRTQSYVPVVATLGGYRVLGVLTLDAPELIAPTAESIEVDGTTYPLIEVTYTSIVTGQTVQYMAVPVGDLDERSNAYVNYKRFTSITSQNPQEARWIEASPYTLEPDTRTEVDKFLASMTNDMYVDPALPQ